MANVLNHTNGIPNIFLPGSDLEDGRRILAIAKHNRDSRRFLVLCQWHGEFAVWQLVNNVGQKPYTVDGDYRYALSEAVDVFNYRATKYPDTYTIHVDA